MSSWLNKKGDKIKHNLLSCRVVFMHLFKIFIIYVGMRFPWVWNGGTHQVVRSQEEVVDLMYLPQECLKALMRLICLRNSLDINSIVSFYLA